MLRVSLHFLIEPWCAMLQFEARIEEFRRVMREGASDMEDAATVPSAEAQEGAFLITTAACGSQRSCCSHELSQRVTCQRYLCISGLVPAHSNAQTLCCAAAYMHALKDWKEKFERVMDELERQEFEQHMQQSKAYFEEHGCEAPPLCWPLVRYLVSWQAAGFLHMRCC